jgi:hypothetical protein
MKNTKKKAVAMLLLSSITNNMHACDEFHQSKETYKIVYVLPEPLQIHNNIDQHISGHYRVLELASSSVCMLSIQLCVYRLSLYTLLA